MDIPVYGPLHAETEEGVVARAAQLYDTEMGEFQDVLNRRFQAQSTNLTVNVVDTTLIINSSTATSTQQQGE